MGMSGSGMLWFLLAVVQLSVAAYAMAAALTWRGEHVWPASGRPLGVVPTTFAALVLAVVVAFLAWVGDGDFSRYFGTGGLMLTSLALVVLVLRRDRHTD
jgi:hypothetical protein